MCLFRVPKQQNQQAGQYVAIRRGDLLEQSVGCCELDVGVLHGGGTSLALRRPIITARCNYSAPRRCSGCARRQHSAAPAYVVGLGGDLPVWPRQSVLPCATLCYLAYVLGSSSCINRESFIQPLSPLAQPHQSVPQTIWQSARVCKLISAIYRPRVFHTQHPLQILAMVSFRLGSPGRHRIALLTFLTISRLPFRSVSDHPTPT